MRMERPIPELVLTSAKGVPPDTADKLRKMLAFLDDMQDPEELRSLLAWKVHTLTDDRKDTWSLSVTRNAA
jgi:toxin HigB-1